MEVTQRRNQRNGSAMNRFLFVLLCIFLFDNALSGGGKWLSISGFSLRNLIAVILVLSEIPIVFIFRKRFIKETSFVWLVLFGAVFLLSSYLGFASGNDRSIIVYDLTMYAYIFLLPISLFLLDSAERFDFLLKGIFAISTLLSCFSIFLQVLFVHFPHQANAVYLWNDISQFGIIGPGSANLFRVFMKSMPFSFIAIIWGMHRSYIAKHKLTSIVVCFSISLNLVSLFLSYTRSIYLGLVFAVISFTVLSLGLFKLRSLLLTILWIAVSTSLILLVLNFSNGADYLGYAIRRTAILPQLSVPGDIVEENVPPQPQESVVTLLPNSSVSEDTSIAQTIESDSIRLTSLRELTAAIIEKPLFGHGLGYTAPSRVHQELAYLDLAAKTGLLGLLVFVAPILFMGIVLFTHRKRGVPVNTMIIYSGLVGVSITSFFNPYLSNSIGASIYILAMTVFSINIVKNKSSAFTIPFHKRDEVKADDKVILCTKGRLWRNL